MKIKIVILHQPKTPENADLAEMMKLSKGDDRAGYAETLTVDLDSPPYP